MRASALSPPSSTSANGAFGDIEIGKRALNGNASAAEKVVGKIARQVNTRGAQSRNGVRGSQPRTRKKALDRMTSANGNNTGGRAAQRGNVRGAPQARPKSRASARI